MRETDVIQLIAYALQLLREKRLGQIHDRLITLHRLSKAARSAGGLPSVMRVLTLLEVPVVAVFEADFPFRFPPLCSNDREAEVGTRGAAGARTG